MMAMVWSWAFGNETEADLESIGFDLSFSFQGASAAWSAESTSVDPLNAYTYSGSPTRYSLGADTNSNSGSSEGLLVVPGAAYPGDGTAATAQGIIAFAYRATNVSVFQRNPRLLEVQTTSTPNACYIQTTISSGAISLYVDNTFKGTSAPVNASNWNYIALVFDLTTTTYSGSLYVNGVLEASGTDGAFGTGGLSLIRLRTTQYGIGIGATSLFGQFITYDDPVGDLAGAVSPDNFVTRIVPNANGAGTAGTWLVPDPASGTDGATGTPDTTFTSASATFTSTIGLGAVSGYTLTVGATTVAIQAVIADDELLVATGLGAGLTGLTYSVQDTNLFGAVSPPIDNTTYAGITAPTPLDRLEVQTASATDLQNLLGVNPNSIKGATVHSVSLGTATTAKVGIQEGGSETLSAAQPVLTSDTYLVESVANNPSTGTAWVGADQPILVYEIDTV